MENANNPKRTWRSVLKSKKVVVCVIILAFIAISLISSIIQYNYGDIASKPLYLEVLYYSTQIASSLFVTAGVIIAVWQYYLSSKSAKTDLEIVQVQRAIDLSEYYKDNILKYFPAIHYIFSSTGISEIFEGIRIDEMVDFDSHELNKLLTPTQINKLKDIQFTDIFLKAVIEANDIYGLNLHFVSFEAENETEGYSAKIKHIDKTSLIAAFMSNLLNAVLNNLEYFALHFRHQTADESVVYQSLHQSYLQIIPYLYYYIAKHNTNSSNKLYTNVVWLFGKWKAKKYAQDLERSQKSLSVQSHGTIIEK